MKAVGFAVFSSIRPKRVRTPAIDVEMGNWLARGYMIPDELMSPMTPEVMGDGSCGPCGTLCPMGMTSTDESGAYGVVVLGSTAGNANVNGSGSAGNLALDQSLALSTSYLHEGAILLAGVIHLGYTYCASMSRVIFAWTDQRGEILDS